MQQLVGTRIEDTRDDFLLFIGRVLPSCLPDLYLHNTLSRYRLLRLYFRCLFNAVHTIRTCKSFQTNDFQDRFLTTRTHGRLCGLVLFLRKTRSTTRNLNLRNFSACYYTILACVILAFMSPTTLSEVSTHKRRV